MRNRQLTAANLKRTAQPSGRGADDRHRSLLRRVVWCTLIVVVPGCGSNETAAPSEQPNLTEYAAVASGTAGRSLPPAWMGEHVIRPLPPLPENARSQRRSWPSEVVLRPVDASPTRPSFSQERIATAPESAPATADSTEVVSSEPVGPTIVDPHAVHPHPGPPPQKGEGGSQDPGPQGGSQDPGPQGGSQDPGRPIGTGP